MDYKNNIYTGAGATTGIINGLNKIADAVKMTLGAAGGNAILEEDLYPGYIITNDGYSILEKTKFQDPLEEFGRKILFDSVARANKQSGDGSTTTTVLTQAILNEGLKTGASGMEIKRSLDELLPLIDEKIDEQKKLITEKEVASVATISAEDEKMGALLQEIYERIGKDGIIELDNSKTFETSYEVKEGVRFHCGTVSPYFYNKSTYAEYDKPSILVVKQKIATVNDIVPIVEKLAENHKRELVIFCDDVADAVTGTLVMNTIQGKFTFLIIKAPTIWKDFVFEDFAKCTAATIIGDETGVFLKDVTLDHIGTCEKVFVDKAETRLLGIADVSEHIKTLEEKGDDDSIRRVCWLRTKAAVLKLGANSETELSYKRLKAEDAINASRLALEDGVVPGGGVTLLNVAMSMPNTLGGKILATALIAPLAQIIENAGKHNQETILPLENSLTLGFNAKTGEIVDMWEAQIIDPAKVVKNAVRNAISVAGTALTIKVALPKDKEEENMEKLMSMIRQPQY